MFNKHFCSALGMKQEDISIPYDVVDRNESLPSVTKKEVRQQLLKLNIFISTGLDYFRPKNLKGTSWEAKFNHLITTYKKEVSVLPCCLVGTKLLYFRRLVKIPLSIIWCKTSPTKQTLNLFNLYLYCTILLRLMQTWCCWWSVLYIKTSPSYLI